MVLFRVVTAVELIFAFVIGAEVLVCFVCAVVTFGCVVDLETVALLCSGATVMFLVPIGVIVVVEVVTFVLLELNVELFGKVEALFSV